MRRGTFKPKSSVWFFPSWRFVKSPLAGRLDNEKWETKTLVPQPALHNEAKQPSCHILREKRLFYYSTLDVRSWEKNRTRHYLTRRLRKYICSHIFIQTGERRWDKGRVSHWPAESCCCSCCCNLGFIYRRQPLILQSQGVGKKHILVHFKAWKQQHWRIRCDDCRDFLPAHKHLHLLHLFPSKVLPMSSFTRRPISGWLDPGAVPVARWSASKSTFFWILVSVLAPSSLRLSVWPECVRYLLMCVCCSKVWAVRICLLSDD